MKKLLAIFILCAGIGSCAVAQADRWRHGGGYHYHPYYGWALPAVVGGVIVYEATRPPPFVIQQSPVYVQQTNPPYALAYPPPAGYHWETLLDAACTCYKTVLIPN